MTRSNRPCGTLPPPPLQRLHHRRDAYARRRLDHGHCLRNLAATEGYFVFASSPAKSDPLTVNALNRRRFITASSVMASACAADLSFLAPLGRAAATSTQIRPGDFIFGPDTDRLLRLLRNTSREECVPAFIKEIKGGLSYGQFLVVLFLAAIENGDPHQVAQVYGAHRVSSDVPVEERLLPLFWILNRIKQEYETGMEAKSVARPFRGQLPAASQAKELFREALRNSDPQTAERAALALARDHGSRHLLYQLWEFAPRNVGDNLGHPAIALANSLRALDAMGWQHSDVALRYVTRYIGGYKGDKTYAPNLNRVERALPGLPPDWMSAAGEKDLTLTLYQILREGKFSDASDLICGELRSGKIKAGAAWDAIHLAAADSIFRHKTGGGALGAHVHAVTTTNALRYGFDFANDPRMKLLSLLQAAGVVADFYVRHFARQGDLRDLSLLNLSNADGKPRGTLRNVFELLPFKARDHFEPKPGEREASDAACRLAFDLLQNERDQAAFMRTARSFLCVKATLDPHDVKFPVAIFEDAFSASPEWRPFLLASSVHALHGSKSADTPALAKVREALG